MNIKSAKESRQKIRDRDDARAKSAIEDVEAKSEKLEELEKRLLEAKNDVSRNGIRGAIKDEKSRISLSVKRELKKQMAARGFPVG